MKTLAIALLLAFAAPLAASAATQSVAQKVEQTCHTNFPAAENQVTQTYGYGG
jgi:opacity protein-like surface antigen